MSGGLRVAVVGATGNVGTSVVAALARSPEVESIIGIARRRPELDLDKTQWVAADMTRDDLRPLFDGVDVVVHLAWLIQPSRNPALTGEVNLGGLERTVAAAAETVPAFVYASSVGAYAPGPKDRAVDESWPTTGIDGSYYSEQKAEAERILDRVENANGGLRVVRMRPGLIFKREAAAEIRRFFLGPFAPTSAIGKALLKGRLPLVPDVKRLRIQAVHSDDVGEAYLLAALSDARGPFNIAADPVLDPEVLGSILDARLVPMRGSVLRALADVTWRARLQPTSPGWVDMALNVPLLNCARAREELGWQPQHSAEDALRDLIAGWAAGTSFATPPLAAETSGRLRSREVRAGVGGRPL
jgi:UDP-glucose 4-epimerase